MERSKNKSDFNFDIAIIGAGPAGASLAFLLRQDGYRVVLIDKDKFPRNKICAGGLPVKVSKILPFDISSIIEKEIYEVTLTHRLNNEFKRSYPKPLLHIINREKFDYYLVRQAIKIGAEFFEEQKIETVSFEENTWIVKLADKVIKASVLVGADGATSFVAKQLSLKPSNYFHIGLQYEVPIYLFKNQEYLEKGIVIDWGRFSDSYGWIFPKKESASIGVQGPLKNGKQLKVYLDDFLNYHGISPEKLVLMGHLIPHRTDKKTIFTKNAILIGDAAGSTDYWTGEGIFYAIKSSKIAAKKIKRFLNGEASLDEYEIAIDKEIMLEIKASYQFSRIFNYISKLAFKIIKKYDYPWDIFCRIMRGDRSFSDIKKRFRPDILLGKLLFQSRRGNIEK